MHRVCGARTRRGRCMSQPASGHLRCRLHGSAGGRPPGIPLRAHENAALQSGRARWLQRMRQAKDAGLIERFPNGRRRGVPNGARAPDKHIRRAQLVIERLRDMVKKAVPALPADVLPAQPPTVAERQADNLDRALDVVGQILALPVAPENVKLLAQQKDAALTTISQSIRIDETRLRAAQTPDIGDYEQMFEVEAARPIEETAAKRRKRND